MAIMELAAFEATRREATLKERRWAIMPVIQVFLYLQVLDLMTTLVGFKLGLAEASPFIRLLTSAGPMAGVLMSKGIAVGLGAVCVYTRKVHLIAWINYWYAVLVVWNLYLILVVALRLS
jgi:hypothetical protein